MKPLTSLSDLQLMSNTLRQDVIKMLAVSQSGHPAGALGMADIFTVLYFNVLKHNPKKVNWEQRDLLVLSNGHICPVMYAAMAHSGYFPVKELLTLRQLGSRLQGHPHRESLPGLETTSGPLGSGISQAVGMAYALKLDKKPNLVFCLVSDGEHDEGNTWEAVLLAAKYKLNNLICIMDRNKIQLSGRTEDILPLDSLEAKYHAFNWNVKVIDGNNLKEVLETLTLSRKNQDRPLMIIANTIPGKGVSFMENDYHWHGMAPSKEQAQAALAELQKERLKIK